jgi:hypothetical protein
MRISREALSLSILVRRVGTGAAAFGWEVHNADTVGPMHISADRFSSMEAAYRAGQARLADFITKRSTPTRVTANRRWQSRQVNPDVCGAQATSPDSRTDGPTP